MPRLFERLEPMLPDTFLLETAKEALDHAILLRRVRRDEFLLEPVVATGLLEPTALKDQAIVTAQHRRRPGRSKRVKALQTHGSDGPLGLVRSAA